MVLIELFSGIGGFALGLQQAGFEFSEHYFSEIDKNAIANYQYNFPHAKHLGSVELVSGKQFSAQETLITFGSPCQDFSNAGKRMGMDGHRSSLISEAIRLITECRPSIFIWENVKGAFSSNNGEDFWAIISAFTHIGGYRLEWQLLNTKWVLPQNRERIYLVGHLAGKCSGGIFPITENNFGFTQRASNPTIARTLTAGLHSGGLHSGMTLIKSNNQQGYEPGKVGDSVNIGVINSSTKRGVVGNQISNTLDTQCTQGVIVPNESLLYWKNSSTKWCIDDRNIVPALNRQTDLCRGTFIKQVNHKQNFSTGTKQQDRVYDPNGVMACLSSSRTDDKTKIKVAAMRGRGENWEQNLEYKEDGITNTLTCATKDNLLASPTTVRRLTEIECERLQGFPDNWTEFGNFNGTVRKIAKTNRYKMIGNAVTVDIVKLVGERILQKLN